MRRIAVLGLVLAGATCGEDLDAIFAPLADTKTPGLAVLVVKNGRAVFEHGYGVRDLRTLARIDARTDFRLASFTKQFTAMAVMLLVHDGKLRYDERVTDVFREFPSYGQAITIRHLLTHTSGLPDYENLMQGGTWTETHQIQDQEVLGLLEHQRMSKFAPGTNWAYSNSGYVMLGLVVSKASGMPFGRFLESRIFEPLHMNHTLVFINGQNTVAQRAYGHTKEGERFVETDQSATSATLGDGGIYSNPEDLAKWDRALAEHTLLSKSETQPAITPVRLNDGADPHWPAAHDDDNLHPGQPVSYGFGWFLDPFEGHARMWHTGSTMGFRTVIERFTREGLTIVILCNRTDLEPEKLAFRVYAALTAPK